MELQKVIEPARELVRSIGEKALNWIIPREALDMFVQNESARRTAPQLPFEDFQE